MIVTCAACSTRYLVDSSVLGPTGRRVRCARCSETWHQKPPEDAPPPLEPVIEAAPHGGRIQLPALRQPLPPPRPSHAAQWGLVVLAVLALLLIGALWQRAALARAWPPAERVFSLIGLPAMPPGSGLDLRIAATARENDNGVPALVVDGEIVNVSPVARAVPRLRIILRDNAEHELQSRIVTVTGERLLPGTSIPFHALVDSPTEAATQVAVTFAAGGS